MRIERGNNSVIQPGTVAAAERFVPDADGAFAVEISEEEGEYALLAARPSEPDPKDEIVAAVSFRVDADSGALILPSDGVSGEVDLGTVSFVDGEGVPSTILSESDGVIPAASIRAMRELADSDNSVKLLANDHVNYKETGYNYLPEISVHYHGPTLASLLAGTATRDDYSYAETQVLVFSEDASTQLTFESPSGVPQGASGNYGSVSSNKWNLVIADPSMEDGWWKLLDASTSAVLAEYNLAIGVPRDAAGSPLSIVPLPTFVRNNNGWVTGIEVDWVSSDGNPDVELTDPLALDILIGTQEFNFTASPSPGSYLFDDPPGSRESMTLEGDFRSMTLSEPFDPATITSSHFWFRFGYYRVLVMFD